MKYLTSTHKRPVDPQAVTNGIVSLEGFLRTSTVAQMAAQGVYRHDTTPPDEPAPLGTAWSETSDAEGTIWIKTPAGTEAERTAATLKAKWKAQAEAHARIQAKNTLAVPLTADSSPLDVQERIDSLQTLGAL